ncbi:MAG: hypothetical protein RBT02_10915 [Bacteroidales bacterium]|nr:hypothetical protein [Bacteroidales bacterium]
MKKIILGISALVILMFVVISAVNGQNDQKKDKKAKTEAVKDCSKCPSAATCEMAAGEAPVPGSQAKHAQTNCDPAKCKEGKCDTACKASCTKTGPDASCNPAKCHSGSMVKK